MATIAEVALGPERLHESCTRSTGASRGGAWRSRRRTTSHHGRTPDGDRHRGRWSPRSSPRRRQGRRTRSSTSPSARPPGPDARGGRAAGGAVPRRGRTHRAPPRRRDHRCAGPVGAASAAARGARRARGAPADGDAPADLREKALYLAARLLELVEATPVGGGYRAAQTASIRAGPSTRSSASSPRRGDRRWRRHVIAGGRSPTDGRVRETIAGRSRGSRSGGCARQRRRRHPAVPDRRRRRRVASRSSRSTPSTAQLEFARDYARRAQTSSITDSDVRAGGAPVRGRIPVSAREGRRTSHRRERLPRRHRRYGGLDVAESLRRGAPWTTPLRRSSSAPG
jgi:hypothetical protein